jgi:hypothetical protein
VELVQKTSPDAERQLYFWRQIVASGEATLEERVKMAICHLAQRQQDEARAILDSFSPQDREGRHGLELQAYLKRAEGRPNEAVELLRRAWTLASDDPESRLKLAAMNLKNPFREIQEQANATLWEMASRQDEFALAAMEILARDTRLPESRAGQLLELAKEHPFMSVGRRLQVVSAIIQSVPERKGALIDAEGARFEGQPMEVRMEYLRWLATTGGHERFLEEVPREKAMLMRELFPLYAEALAGAERWEELKGVLAEAGGMPMNPATKALLQARVAEGTGEPVNIVRGYFQEACRHAAATRDYRGLLRSAGFAEAAGFGEIALEAYRTAGEASSDPAVMERVLAMETGRQNAAAVLETVEKLLELQPMSKEHGAKVLYLKLLLGEELEITAQRTQELLSEDRLEADAAGFLEGLAAYRAIDLERMKAVLAQVEEDGLPVGQRAVLAGLLGIAGETARAFAIAERISPLLLLAEEEVFLRQAL